MDITNNDKNPYNARNERRQILHAYCLLEPVIPDPSMAPQVCSTINYSPGGLCIKQDGDRPHGGVSYLVTVKALNSIQQRATVVWTMEIDRETSLAGLKWL